MARPASGIKVTAPDLAAYVAAVTGHPAFTGRFTEELVTPGIRVPIIADPELFAAAVALGGEWIWAATFGAAFADPQMGRPVGETAYPATDARRVQNIQPIGPGLPERISYNSVSETVNIGRGSFGPVTDRVWTYDVGGMNVVKHWFDYRKDNPGGRKSSPLDDVHVTEWPLEWVREFNELLTALHRISDLEAEQASLLDRIVEGPTLTKAGLMAEGVKFPLTARDRRPRYGLESADDQYGTLL